MLFNPQKNKFYPRQTCQPYSVKIKIYVVQYFKEKNQKGNPKTTYWEKSKLFSVCY